ncbi:2-hydroxymuconate tautomerase [Vagococcus zengguangii]|uniref:Tautomerase n=1 Tax=Vagococcus zengguangii TaxID=2571750 RepID=A0A4D7CVZ2_9ENTE|nr:2-hydroxymuconate tautomerase [Vagococcus zengguangii]QCI86431.1 4-oxalocrotonate tautomerase [Vagococcus zengguangii]TLG81319.1 4-oxalocrotonate tautomerase [Vagococcus zengguangii]
MPIVHIELLEGRTDEQKKSMVQEVTEAISKTSGAPKENIHVVIQEMKKEHYAVGGVLKSELN